MMRRHTVTTAALCTGALIWGGGSTFAAQQQQPQQQQQRTGAQRNPGDQMGKSPAMKAPTAEVAGQGKTVMTLVTSAGRIASSPASLYGTNVSVHTQVADVIAPGVFTLDEDQWFAGPDILVIAPGARAGAAALNDGQYITVVGTVRQYIQTELERDFGWFDFDDLPDLDVEFESRPVIVADVVRTSAGRVIVNDDKSVRRVYVASPGDIADVPGRFYGRSVSVRGEVEDVESPRFFTLDEEQLFVGPDLLVMNPHPLLPAEDGEMVTAIGIVRPFVRLEFERDYDWFDADQFGVDVDLEDYERRPVLIAHSVIGRDDRQFVRVVPNFTLERTERALADRMDGRDRQNTERTAERPTGTAGQQGREAITDVSQILQTTDVNQLVDRTVALSNVRVQRVEDARTIWIGSSAERSVPVRIAEVAGAPTEEQLKTGASVTLKGTIMKPLAGATGALGNVPYFIHANEIRVAK